MCIVVNKGHIITNHSIVLKIFYRFFYYQKCNILFDNTLFYINFFTRMQLIFSTHNQFKLVELQQLLKDKVTLLSLSDLGVFEEIEETGKTLKDNALLKAKIIYDKYGKNVFADDTGLEIEALNGAPGVLSARFAGEEKNATKNIEKVLKLLEDKKNRKACFKTVIALILNGKDYFFEGTVEGQILYKPIGSRGFGYDPIFMPDGYEVSFAQMEPETKNRISHRGKAVEKLIKFLNN